MKNWFVELLITSKGLEEKQLWKFRRLLLKNWYGQHSSTTATWQSLSMQVRADSHWPNWIWGDFKFSPYPQEKWRLIDQEIITLSLSSTSGDTPHYNDFASSEIIWLGEWSCQFCNVVHKVFSDNAARQGTMEEKL